jgi:uncharacterized repeat protein (TIGR03803 family)
MVGRAAVLVSLLMLAMSDTAAASTVAGGVSASDPAARAAQFRSLFSFDFTNGYGPNELLATAGGFVGTAYGGGNSGHALACSSLGCGLIFSFAAGKYRILYRFSGPDGANPAMGLIPGASGTYFGTTYYGGGAENGTVFQFSGNQVTTLYTFSGGADGGQPTRLVSAGTSNFYGITQTAGLGSEYGTIFRLAGGMLTTIKTFGTGDPSVGIVPSGIIRGADGNLYGTVEQGDATHTGSIFQVTPSGGYATLHTFMPRDGSYLAAGIIQANDGNFYGGAYAGGNLSTCRKRFIRGCGSIYRLTPSGKFTVLHTFAGPDGVGPSAPLVQASDGSLYGTTSSGGKQRCGQLHDGCGTIFRIGLDGSFATLHVFSGRDGANAEGAMIQGSDGALYGTTSGGGKNGDGSIFRLVI